MGYELGLSEFKEMERRCSEGVGVLAAWVHETESHPVFDLEAAFGLLTTNPSPLE